jgi:hypothetical protein
MKRRVLLLVVVGVALAVVLEGVFVIRLSTSSPWSHHAYPGQVIAVDIDGEWKELKSSDESVVAPIRVTVSPRTIGYFLAVRPGKAILATRALHSCREAVPQCLMPEMRWAAEIDVRLLGWSS